MRFIRNTLDSFGAMVSYGLSVALVVVLMAGCLVAVGHQAVAQGNMRSLVITLLRPDKMEMKAEDPEARPFYHTEVAREAVELYLDDLLARLEGEPGKMNPETLRQLVEKHWEEMAAVVSRTEQWHMLLEAGNAPTQEAFAQELLSRYIQRFGTEEPASVLPAPVFPKGFSLEEWKDFGLYFWEYLKSLWILDGKIAEDLLGQKLAPRAMTRTVNQFMLLLENGRGLKLLSLAAVVLGLLILFFRMGDGFRGFFWLGTNSMVAGAMHLGISIVLLVQRKNLEVDGGIIGYFSETDTFLKWYLMVGAGIFALGLLLVIFASWGDRMLDKRHRKKK